MDWECTMRRTIILTGLILLVAFEVFQSAAAVHTACPEPAASSASTALTELHVSSTQSYLDTSGCDGERFYSEADNCPTPAIEAVAVRGAYCGFTVLANASALCKWTSVSNTPSTALYVGFDWSDDGVLSASNESVWGPMAAGQFYEVTNTGASARLIAFPTNIDDDTLYPLDESIISCGPL